VLRLPVHRSRLRAAAALRRQLSRYNLRQTKGIEGFADDSAAPFSGGPRLRLLLVEEMMDAGLVPVLPQATGERSKLLPLKS
jgi:hypothetical protein